jgi:hypothetical protein
MYFGLHVKYQFKYLETTAKIQNSIHEEGKSRLNSGDACCCFVWVETWSLTLRKEHRLGVFENRVLRRIFGPKRKEVVEGGQDCMMSIVTCTLHQMLFG